MVRGRSRGRSPLTFRRQRRCSRSRSAWATNCGRFDPSRLAYVPACLSKSNSIVSAMVLGPGALTDAGAAASMPAHPGVLRFSAPPSKAYQAPGMAILSTSNRAVSAFRWAGVSAMKRSQGDSGPRLLLLLILVSSFADSCFVARASLPCLSGKNMGETPMPQ